MPAPTYPAPPPTQPVAPLQPAPANAPEDLPNIDALLAIVGNAQTIAPQPVAQAAPQPLDVPTMHPPAHMSPQPAAGMATQPHYPRLADAPPASMAPHQPGNAVPGHMGGMPSYQAAPSLPLPAEHTRPTQMQVPQGMPGPQHAVMHPQGLPQPAGVAQMPQYGRPGQPVQAHLPHMTAQMHALPAPGTSLPMPVQYAPQQAQQAQHGGGPGAAVIIQASPGTLHAPAHQAQPRYAPQPLPQPQPGPPQAGPPQPQPGAYPGWKMGGGGYAGSHSGERDGRGGGDGRDGSYGGRHKERGWGDDIMARGAGPGTGAKRKASQWDERGGPRPGPEPGYDMGGRYDGHGGNGGRRRMGSGAARRGAESDDRGGGRGGRGWAPARRENTHTLNHLHAPPPDLLPATRRSGRGPALQPPPPPPPPP